MKKISKSHYEIIKKLNLYKKDLGNGFHLCTIYGVAGDKTQPLWKRFLSHIYVIVRYKIVED